MRAARILILASLFALLGAQAGAQWTVINLHPAGAVHSEAYGVSAGQQVGRATIGGGYRAGLWNGTAASWVDLNPAGAANSAAFGVGSGRQVGSASFGGVGRAGMWSGTSATWVDLNPAGAAYSAAFGVDGGVQVGFADVGGVDRASLWNGTAASWLDLHPANASSSYATGVGDGQQVGVVTLNGENRASLWHSTAASWVDLHPVGAVYSEAFGVDGGQQVGYASFGGEFRASLWGGTAASWVDLHPVGASFSLATGLGGSHQVGYVEVAAGERASLWSGTAASWVDLHAFLPSDFSSSYARGIWNDGTSTYVVGHGYNDTTGFQEALMWVFSGAVLPYQYRLVFGQYLSGNLQSLLFDDDDRLVATMSLAAETVNPIQIDVSGTCPTANPSSLKFIVEARADTDGRGVYLRLFDFASQTWVTVFTGSVNSTDSTITVAITSNPSRFVNPQTLELRAALVFHEGAAELVQPLTVGVDRVGWVVTP